MTFEYFCEWIARYTNVSTDCIKEHSSFRDDLGIDSLQMVNFLTRITEHFSVGFEVIENAEDLLTAGNLYRAMQRRGETDEHVDGRFTANQG